MKLHIRQRDGQLPEVVTADGEVVQNVRMVQVRHEVAKPVIVTIEFFDYGLSKRDLSALPSGPQVVKHG